MVVVVVVVVDGVCVAPERGKASGIVGNLITTSFQEKKKILETKMTNVAKQVIYGRETYGLI